MKFFFFLPKQQAEEKVNQVLDVNTSRIISSYQPSRQSLENAFHATDANQTNNLMVGEKLVRYPNPFSFPKSWDVSCDRAAKSNVIWGRDWVGIFNGLQYSHRHQMSKIVGYPVFPNQIASMCFLFNLLYSISQSHYHLVSAFLRKVTGSVNENVSENVELDSRGLRWLVMLL